MYRRVACATAARRRRETTCSERVENVEHKRVVLRSKVEHPEDVDHSEDEPAGGHGVQRGTAREDALVDTDYGKDDGYRAESSYLEPVHGDRVTCQGMEDTEDEEELEENGKP